MEINFDIKKLPRDVVTLICSFGYPEYKQRMKKICKQLDIRHYIDYNIELLGQEFHRFNHIFDNGLSFYMSSAIEIHLLEDLFKQCTKCYCCSKHCHNRPMNYYTDEVSIGENVQTDCMCKCRHIARFIQRCSHGRRTHKRYTTFHNQFIPLWSRTRRGHALFHQANPPTLF